MLFNFNFHPSFALSVGTFASSGVQAHLVADTNCRCLCRGLHFPACLAEFHRSADVHDAAKREIPDLAGPISGRLHLQCEQDKQEGGSGLRRRTVHTQAHSYFIQAKLVYFIFIVLIFEKSHRFRWFCVVQFCQSYQGSTQLHGRLDIQ